MQLVMDVALKINYYTKQKFNFLVRISLVNMNKTSVLLA